MVQVGDRLHGMGMARALEFSGCKYSLPIWTSAVFCCNRNMTEYERMEYDRKIVMKFHKSEVNYKHGHISSRAPSPLLLRYAIPCHSNPREQRKRGSRPSRF